MALTVDSIENGIITCIDSDKNIIELKFDETAGMIYEGCVLVYDETGKKYIMDEDATHSRKKAAREKLRKLFNKNK